MQNKAESLRHSDGTTISTTSTTCQPGDSQESPGHGVTHRHPILRGEPDETSATKIGSHRNCQMIVLEVRKLNFTTMFDHTAVVKPYRIYSMCMEFSTGVISFSHAALQIVRETQRLAPAVCRPAAHSGSEIK